MVWTVNNSRTPELLKKTQRYIRQLFCFYHKILYIRYVAANSLDRALEFNEQIRDVAKGLKRLITTETLDSSSVRDRLQSCERSLQQYQGIINPIRADFDSLDIQGQNYEHTLRTLRKKYTEADLELLYKLPANFDVDRYRIDALWDKTRGWFVKNSDQTTEWVELHDLDLNLPDWDRGLDSFKQKIEALFGFPLPEAWWQDRNSVKNIHENLKHLCGDTSCGSSNTGNKPITIASAYLIALIAYVKIFRGSSLENIPLTQNIDWKQCYPHAFLAVQDPQTARASARALYDFFCAVFRASEPQIEDAHFAKNGAQLKIQLWDASGKFSKFGQSGLQIPETVANTSEAILQLWRFMLPSKSGFMSPGTIYMKDKLLILSSSDE